MLSNKHAMFLPFALMAMLKCHRIIVIRLKQPAGEWARKFKALPIKSKGILYLYVRYAPSSIYSCFIKLLGFFYTQDSNCDWLSIYFTFLFLFWSKNLYLLKFIYSEKATKFCEISTVDLSYVLSVKSAVEILQNFASFSGYLNFKTEPSINNTR